MAEAKPASRAILPFAAVSLIWGSTWLVIRDQVSSVPVGWTVTWRFLAASLGMAVLALLRRESLRIPREGFWLAGWLGFFQFFVNFQLVYHAEQLLTSGIVAVLYAMLLVPNAALARIFLGTPVSRRFLAGSAVALAGIALLLLHEVRGAAIQRSALLGAAMAITGMLCASASNILQASEAGHRQPMVPMLAWAMALGATMDAAFAFATSGAPVFDPTPRYALGIAYLALLGSVVTFPLYFGLIRLIGAGRAAYSGVAVPVLAMVLSTLFEHYRWSALAAGGAALAMLGLLVALSGREK